MLNDIVSGISEKLYETFGDGHEIYTEPLKQGLQEPCFLISGIDHNTMPIAGPRSFRGNLFSLKYFPKSTTDPKAECLAVADALFLALEYITAGGDLIRGTDMDVNFVDDVLVFRVAYNIIVRRRDAGFEVMEGFEQATQVKE